MLESNNFKYADKGYLLNNELFPNLSFEFNSDSDFNEDEFAAKPHEYTKKLLNMLESHKINDKDESRTFQALKKAYSKANLFLDKEDRLKFWSIFLRVIPETSHQMLKNPDSKSDDYAFFKALHMKFLDDYIESKESFDIAVSKSLVNFLNNSADADLLAKVDQLSQKIKSQSS